MVNTNINDEIVDATKVDTKNKYFTYNLSGLYCQLCFFCFALILEITNFLWLGIGVLPQYFLLDIAILLIISGLVSLLPSFKAQKITFSLVLLVQIILNMVNVTLYNVFGSFLTINMLNLGQEAATAFSFKFLNFFNIFLNIALYGIFITLLVVISKKVNKQITLKKISKYTIFLAIFLICEYFGFLCYGVSVNSIDGSKDGIIGNDRYLYTSLYLANESYRKFGTYGYYTKQIINILENPYIIKESAEFDATLSQLKSGEGFYENNDMSGSLEGYNVVSILLESYDTFAINPIFTPTLWELQTSTGISFDSFYGRNKTNISEAISFLGSMPSETFLTSLASSNNLYTPFSLPNLIKEDANKKNQTVKTSYVHSYLSSFYGRNTTHPIMGFDEIIGVEEVYGYNPMPTIDQRVYESEFVEKTIDYLLPTDVDRFYTSYSTMTTHGAYDIKLKLFEEYEAYVDANYEEYKVWLEENGYTVPTNSVMEGLFKVYLARTIDMDNAIKVLFDNIESRGLADNTLVVMYGDHAPYYDDLSATIKGYSKDEYYNSRNNNIPLIFYAKNMQPQVVDSFCTHYSIYPTICDLLKLPYNSEFIQSRSVFADKSETPDVFVSFLSGIYNEYFYTENLVDIIYCDTVSNPEEVDPSQIAKFLKDAENFYVKQALVEKVYSNNMFAKIKII